MSGIEHAQVIQAKGRIEGTCHERFGGVRDAFAYNLGSGQDVGASVAIVVDGELVVDLWGGYVDATYTRPWDRHTIAQGFSSTKTVAALCALLVGAILHVLYAEEDKTLAGVASFLSDPRRPIESTLAAMMKTPHLGEAGPHPVIASAARELRNKSENERSGVLSTAMSFLGLYRDPVLWSVC